MPFPPYEPSGYAAGYLDRAYDPGLLAGMLMTPVRTNSRFILTVLDETSIPLATSNSPHFAAGLSTPK